MGSHLKKIKYIKTTQMYLREWQKWQELLVLYINIITFWCYSWESRMHSNNYQVLHSAGNGCNYIHMYARMLTFCVTAIIYYIIINSAYAFIKSTNMIIISQLCIPRCCLQYYSNMPRAHFDPKAFEMPRIKFNIVSYIYGNINKFLPNTIKYFTR